MRAGLGCLLMIAAMVFLFALIVIPVIPQTAENRTIDDYLKAVLCQPDERLIRDQYTYSDYDGTGFSMTVYCEDAENQREDVTTRWTLVGIAAFLVPFLVGLLLLLVGITRRAMKMTEQSGLVRVGGLGSNPQVVLTRYGSSSSPIEGIDLKDNVLKVGGVEISLGDFSTEQVETFKRQAAPMSPDETSLAAKLRQLQEARDAGLISMDEYDRLRQEILDNMG